MVSKEPLWTKFQIDWDYEDYDNHITGEPAHDPKLFYTKPRWFGKVTQWFFFPDNAIGSLLTQIQS